ncbi:hypothetical protein BDN70DRAFT_936620 [Pholiota conissans]|uniref:Uncharacterized protein n=1 Tax=Pholiota conissans TaxID=109636 RepID=A0A9P5YST8_9AGAR|nr:hypothetical protein BDN70DRAFT_936620 [Pholiota conissans]
MFRSRSSSSYSRPVDRSQSASLKCTSLSDSSTSSSESDSWSRHGKRCRNNSRLAQLQCETRSSVDQAPIFATTSAQFNLLSRNSSFAGKTRRHSAKPEAKIAYKRQYTYLPDIVRLRSSAFWELRQSITNNGEGLVRRMREYERSRSRLQIHHKAKEAEKRGRKRLFPSKKKALVYTSDASDDEDILICSAESANHIPRGTFFGKRAASLDSMDVDAHHSDWSDTQRARNRTPSSSPDTRYPTSLPTFESDDVSTLVAEVANRFSISLSEYSQESAPSLSYSLGELASSSLISLPLLSSTIGQIYPLEASPLSQPITSDKALATLTLAFANGAGSISDYSSVCQYQELFQVRSYDNGDLWH